MCLYVTSEETGVGKTAVSAGLGRYLAGKGRKVGFLRLAGDTGEADGVFMKQVLGLNETVADICPVVEGEAGAAAAVKAAYDKMAAGKDTVIVESPLDAELIRALAASVIAVESYTGKAPVKSPEVYGELGPQLLGVVINKVPASKLAGVRDEVTARLEEAGMALLAVLPEDRVLLAPSVAELVGWLEGEILNSAERADELVESLMLGALTVDPGPQYYGLKNNKAVVVRAERPDMQLAALETSTRCLVLCGETAPTHAVCYQAEKKKVPVIQVRQGVAGVISALEEALGQGRFGQEKKLPRLAELMGQNFDFSRLAG